MISSTLEHLGDELRQAAARRAYAEIAPLVAKLRAAAAEEARALPAGDPGVRGIEAWVKEVFRAAEVLVRIGRASQADELRRITFLQRYLPPPDRRASRVKITL